MKVTHLPQCPVCGSGYIEYDNETDTLNCTECGTAFEYEPDNE